MLSSAKDRATAEDVRPQLSFGRCTPVAQAPGQSASHECPGWLVITMCVSQSPMVCRIRSHDHNPWSQSSHYGSPSCFIHAVHAEGFPMTCRWCSTAVTWWT